MKRIILMLLSCLLATSLWAAENSLQDVVMDEAGNYISLRYFEQESDARTTFNINKRDNEGTFQWQVAFEAHGPAEIKTLHSGANGFTIIAGNFRGTLFTQSWQLVSSGKQDSFVAVIDADGAVWMSQMGGIHDSQIRGSQLLSNGNFVVFGTFEGMLFIENLPVYSGDQKGWFYATFSPNGALLNLDQLATNREAREKSPLSQSDLETLHRVLNPKAGPPQERFIVENPVNDDIPNPHDPNQTDPGGTGSGDGG